MISVTHTHRHFVKKCHTVFSYIIFMSITVGDYVQTTEQYNPLFSISGTVVEIYDNLVVISDDDAETDDDRLEFHVDDLEVA